MKKALTRSAWILLAFALVAVPHARAQVSLIAIGELDGSRAGSLADLSGLNYNLENGDPANLLGGLGSAICYASGNTFLALPDRGPNAQPFDSNIDDTVSYINRFHTITMDLKPNTSGTGLPFTLTPTLRATTLLWSLTPLVYGKGDTIVGSGAPRINNFFLHFFTGRSDNFDPNRNSGDPNDARFDSEGMRLSNDGLRVYISDEYGPYVYEFDRLTGVRLRSFQLPSSFYVNTLSSMGAVEISGNTSGRVANKGMEGLAITPDGRTLVGIMQNALIQDAAEGGAAANVLRIVTIDIASGRVTHQFAYLLTTGSGVSEILAINNHEFLVDERDGKGREANLPPDLSTKVTVNKSKLLYKIDLDGAVDVTNMDGLGAAANAVPKTVFLDVAGVLIANGVPADQVPSKIEGIAFGPDVKEGKTTVHTLWVGNDNDFFLNVLDSNGKPILNPSQFFVFSFTDADLAGSQFVPQQFRGFGFLW
ncbi:MAG TPA: esterase-like activity of phytase family protein [Candidatus Limnocylindrales bacterium]|nr:esterase-like activity of phytase family protein [Candidatus Limnocylindrales bacterium]